jgi:hypothetical protein
MLYKMTKVLHFKNYRLEDEGCDSALDHQTNASDDDVQRDMKRDETEKSYDDLRDGKVLMVDQLWLWIVDNGIYFLKAHRAPEEILLTSPQQLPSLASRR